MLATLIVGVLAVTQTINLQGTVDFNVTGKSLYLKSASVQYEEAGQEQPLEELTSFLPGYINTEFNLNLGSISSTTGLYIINLDIINTTTSRYNIGVEYTGPESVSVSTTGSIAAGTGDPVSDLSTSSRISISISTTATEIELSDVTVTLSEYVPQVYEGFTFSLNEADKTASLVSYTGTDAAVEIPSTFSISDGAYIEGSDYTVTAIAAGTSSTTGAFYRATGTLQSITIPETITSIGNYAFYGCRGLTTINFNAIEVEDLTSNNQVFYNAGLNGDGIVVTFGSKVTKIPAYLFYPLVNTNPSDPIFAHIKTVYISDSITSIGDSAFADCFDLASIVFSNISQLTSIGNYAFDSCSSLTSITIPDSVTSIGDGAFGACSNLAIIDIGPNSQLTSIGDSAFSSCSSLTSITIPKGVTKIGGDYSGKAPSTFSECTSLTSIYFNAIEVEDLTYNNQVFDNAGQDGDGITVTIGSEVTKIPAYLFNPNNNIPNKALITAVIFEENSQLTSIGKWSFLGCSRITSITIPEKVISIGEYAFSECTRLTEINYNAVNVADLSDTAYHPFYRAGQSGNGITVTFGSNVTRIPAYLFYSSSDSYQATNITTVVFKDNSQLTSIGNSAFYNRTSLTSITIPEDVTSIGGSAFRNCSSLTSVNFGDNSQLTSIGNYAFQSCRSLTSITIPEGVTSIGSYAFQACSSLSSVDFINETGWYRASSSTATSGTDMTVTNTSTNATNLKNTYASYYWKRNA